MGYVVKHSTSNVNKARRKGNVALGVSSEGYDKTSVSGFYAGVEPVEGKHNLVRTSATNDPDFYALTDTELVNFANQLGGSVSNTLTAKNYLLQQDNIIFLDELPNDIETSGLVVDLDARVEASFLDNKPTTNIYPSPDLTTYFTNGFTKVTNFGNFTEVTSDGPWYGLYQRPEVTQGKTYVYSFWYKHVSGATVAGGHTDYSAQRRLDGGSWSGGNILTIPNDGNYHFIEIKFTAGNTGTTNLFLQPGRGNSTTTTGHILTGNGFGVQFEEGEEATPFTSGTRLQNTTWYDLSGNGYDVTLINQPTFNPNGYISFNGQDQRGIQYGLPTVDLETESYTIEVLCKFSSLPNTNIDSYIGNGGGPIYGQSMGNDYQLFAYASSSAGESNLGVSYDDSRNNTNHRTNATIKVDEWVRFTQVGVPYYDGTWWRGKFKYYINGSLDKDATISSDVNVYTMPTTFNLAYDTRYEDYGHVSIASIKRYNRELTADEVKQNYYGGDIVTDGLNWSLDAGNLVSYESGSTTAYSLTGSVYSGSLTNGVAYSNYDGGVWEFDGSDDYISIPTYTFGNGNWTLSMWINADSFSNYNLMSNSSGGPVSNVFGAYGGTPKIFYQNYDGAWQSHYGNTALSTGEWYMLTWVNYQGASSSDGTMQMYVNGRLDSSLFNSFTTNGGPCNVIGKRYSGTSFDGKIGNVFVYTKALSDSEVLQNYNAHKARFL